MESEGPKHIPRDNVFCHPGCPACEQSSKEIIERLEMESEGPYRHFSRATEPFLCPACIYAEGRKDERERCARIAEDLIPTHSHCEDGYKYECYTGHIIADKIRGGQDAK